MTAPLSPAAAAIAAAAPNEDKTSCGCAAGAADSKENRAHTQKNTYNK